MATKAKKVWFCTSCGNESPKWMGRCPACGEWNTMHEELVSKDEGNARTSRSRAFIDTLECKPQPLSQIRTEDEPRIRLSKGSVASSEDIDHTDLRNGQACATYENGLGELDKVLGGGIVPGSLILIGGEPGIGKSTLSLQIPLSCQDLKTLYVSGEESVKQLKMRAERLSQQMIFKSGKQNLETHSGDSIKPDTNGSTTNEPGTVGWSALNNCWVLSETLLENILKQAKENAPQLLIIDSIQTIYSENIDSSAGSVSQVRECAASLLRFAKETNTPTLLIGHITKDGTIAGPKILEHIVDVVLQFEGDTRHSYRVLRSIKNRFGSTDELAVYEMTGKGLREILNPSELFIPMHGENLSGVAVASMVDGNRPFLIEVQSLVSSAVYGVPQRSATGFDVRRMNMLLAVLEKRVGFKLSAKDVFLNIAGGLRINDPACDLAVVAAILSSNFDIAIPARTAFAAEIGLSGEIRPVSQVEKRIIEAEKLGFEQIFVSSFNSLSKVNDKVERSKESAGASRTTKQSGYFQNIKVRQISTIADLVRAIFQEY